MRKLLKLLFSLWLIFFSINLTAQNWDWANNLGSVSAGENGKDIAVDNQGNVYVVGTFTNTIITSLGNLTGSGTGNSDIFIAKYNSIGNLIWTQRINGTAAPSVYLNVIENVSAIDVDNLGNVYIAGQFTGTTTFGTSTVSSGQGSNAIFLVKFDTNGNFQWVKTGINNVPPPNFPWGRVGSEVSDIKTDNQGNTYMTGVSENPIIFSNTTIGGSNYAGFIIKYDTNGNLVFGTNAYINSRRPIKLQVNNNELYTLYASPNTNGVNPYTYVLGVDKYSSLSGLLLTNSPSLVILYNYPNERSDFSISKNGDITVFVDYRLSASTGGISFPVAAGNPDADILLAQFTNSGVFKWAKQLESPTVEIVGGISSDNSNNIYISGTFNNTMNIDATVIQSVGKDIFTAKLTPNGGLEWVRVAGSGNTNANSNVANVRGDVYVVGQFTGTADFDDTQISSNGLADIFVAKLGCEPRPISEVIGDTLICPGTSTYQATQNSNGNNFIWTISGGGTLINSGNTATVNWTQTGIYTITVAQVNECGSGETFTFNVLVEDNSPNVVGAISGDTLVCRNSAAVYTISGNSDFDYTWTVNDGGTVSPLNNSSIVTWQDAGTYQVGVSASNFCGTGDTIFTNVTVKNPLQRPQITFVNDTLFSSNQALSRWYRDGNEIENETDFSFRPINQGIYTMESENICGVTPLSNEFTFGSEGGLFLYPNPGRNIITLRIPPYLTWYSFDAIDQLGRVVVAPVQYDGSNEVLIDVQSLAAGVYWFRIDTEIILLYRKVVIVD